MTSEQQHVRFFATPWTVTLQAPLPTDFPGKNTEAGCHFLFQGIFPTRDGTLISCLAGRFSTTKPPGKPIPIDTQPCPILCVGHTRVVKTYVSQYQQHFWLFSYSGWWWTCDPSTHSLVPFVSFKDATPGTSLVVQWSKLHACNAGAGNSIPGQGTKIPHAAQSG